MCPHPFSIFFHRSLLNAVKETTEVIIFREEAAELNFIEEKLIQAPLKETVRKRKDPQTKVARSKGWILPELASRAQHHDSGRGHAGQTTTSAPARIRPVG